MRLKTHSRLLLAALALALVVAAAQAGEEAEARTLFSNSIKAVPANALSSAALTAAETAGTMEFMVALKMRDLAGLRARIAQGEIIAPEEMAAKYYPLKADYQATVDWLTAQGLKITKTDPCHLGIFVSGSVDLIQKKLQTSLAKVSANGQTYVSAVTAPSLPASLATPVLGINGLQPHIRPRKHSTKMSPPAQTKTPNAPPYWPSEILKAYNANGLGLDGTGQTIAVVIDTFPATSDLTLFWTQTGVAQTLGNIDLINVVGGTLGPPQGEETLDTEWCSGIAPGAKVRVYAVTYLSSWAVDQGYQAIINDLPSQPSLRQVSCSFGSPETDVSSSQMTTDAQYFASMAAAGVSVFVSTGDQGYDPYGFIQVSSPACDPSVTGVGGTSVNLDAATGVVTSESAWDHGGGGISNQFSRPAWQNGWGVPPRTMRMLPDVAAPADPLTGALVVLNGAPYQFGGTSWGAPTWAGLCALINQARANNGLQPVGLLGPKIYPLLGTPNFRDITTGSNGYNAGPGYDLCTGIGVPNVATLAQTLTVGMAYPQTVVDSPNTPVTIILTGVDYAGSTMTAAIVTLPAPGTLYQTPNGSTLGAAITTVPQTVTNSAMQVILVPATDGSGNPYSSFGFTVNAGGLTSPAATVTLIIDNITPPTALPQTVTTNENMTVAITLAGTDNYGVPLSAAIVSLPASGTLYQTTDGVTPGAAITAIPTVVTNGQLWVLYAPAAGGYGRPYTSFGFTANMDAYTSTSATVTVNVIQNLAITSATPLPQAIKNDQYSVTFAAQGGLTPYNWSVNPATGNYAEIDSGAGWLGGGTAQGWHANSIGASWSYTLPWTFTYYGAAYDSVNVCSLGFLDFTTSAVPSYNYDSLLEGAVRIAPLWYNLTTNTGSDDIFVTATSSYVSFRWAAHTYVTAYPVNMEAVLYRNGNIQFNYGAVNTGVYPTIGVSAGDNVHYTLSSYDNVSIIPPNVSSLFMFSSGLPSGLTLDSATGALSGTPTQAGAYSFVVQVADAEATTQTVSALYNLNVVTLGPPAQLAFGQWPSNTTTGAAIAPAVTVLVQDASGNTVITDTSTVTLALGTNPGGGNLGGTLTAAAVAGVATFNTLSLNQAGVGYTLYASDGALTGTTSNPFNITSGPPASITLHNSPSPFGLAGGPVAPAPIFLVADSYGNPVSGLSVTFAVNYGGSVTPTTATTNASGLAGLATWTLGPVAGTNTLTAAAAGVGTQAFVLVDVPAYIGITWAAGTAGTGGALNEGDTTPVSWALGNVAPCAIRHTDGSGLLSDQNVKLFVRNTGNVAELITIACSGSSPSGWLAGSALASPAKPADWSGAGAGVFTAGVASADAGADTQYTAVVGPAPAISAPGGLMPNLAQRFYLLFQAPSSTNTPGVAQAITFTVTATAQ